MRFLYQIQIRILHQQVERNMATPTFIFFCSVFVGIVKLARDRKCGSYSWPTLSNCVITCADLIVYNKVMFVLDLVDQFGATIE